MAAASRLENLPLEILDMIVKEATITEFDTCDNIDQCYRTSFRRFYPAEDEPPSAILNPNIGLLMASKTLNTSLHRISPDHKISLQVCSEACAGYQFGNAGSNMFAGVSSITFKETVSVEEYKEIKDTSEREWKWHMDQKEVDFVLDYIGLAEDLVVRKIDWSAHASSTNANEMDLMWTMTITPCAATWVAAGRPWVE